MLLGRKLIPYIILVIALLGCQSNESPNLRTQATVTEWLEGLNGRPLIRENRGNCTLDQLEAREQGFHVKGGTGGMALEFPGSEATPVAHPSYVSKELVNINKSKLSFLGSTDNVGVIVLDDFKGGAYTLSEKLYEITYDDLAGQTDEEKTASFEEFIDMLVAAGEFSHGAMVMETLASFIYHMPNIKVKSVSPEKIVFNHGKIFQKNKHNRLVVQAVDTEDFNTQVIVPYLESAITSLLQNDNISHIVVNASFSIVMCSVLEDYRQSALPSYQDYIEELALHNNIVGFEQDLLELTLTPSANDPLENFLTFPPTMLVGYGLQSLSTVAAAGNFELDYALSPAHLSNVIAVGSLDVMTNDESGFSNRAQVMAPGAWLRLTDDMKRSGVGHDAKTTVWAGTSAAAPAAAAALGYDLLQKTPQCINGLDSKLINVPNNINLPLTSAMSFYCD